MTIPAKHFVSVGDFAKDPTLAGYKVGENGTMTFEGTISGRKVSIIPMQVLEKMKNDAEKSKLLSSLCVLAAIALAHFNAPLILTIGAFACGMILFAPQYKYEAHCKDIYFLKIMQCIAEGRIPQLLVWDEDNFEKKLESTHIPATSFDANNIEERKKCADILISANHLYYHQLFAQAKEYIEPHIPELTHSTRVRIVIGENFGPYHGSYSW